MKEKVSFKDLSAPLKTVVVFGWISFSLYAIIFFMGFMEGAIS